MERIRQVFSGDFGFEPVESSTAVQSVERAVYVVGFEFEQVWSSPGESFVRLHDLSELLDEVLGILDRAGERDRPTHRLHVPLEDRRLSARLLRTVSASPFQHPVILTGVVQVQFSVLVSAICFWKVLETYFSSTARTSTL